MKWSPLHSCTFFSLTRSILAQNPNTWLKVLPGITAQWSISFISPGSYQNAVMYSSILCLRQAQECNPWRIYKERKVPIRVQLWGMSTCTKKHSAELQGEGLGFSSSLLFNIQQTESILSAVMNSSLEKYEKVLALSLTNHKKS